MSEKNVLYENEGQVLTYDAGVLLGRIAQGLRQGEIALEGESGTVSAPLSNEVSMEIKIKDKTKDGATKRVLEVEMKWVVPTPE